MATGLIGQGTSSHARSAQSKYCRPSYKILWDVVAEHRVASGPLQRANPAPIKAVAPLRLTMSPTAQDAAPPLQSKRGLKALLTEELQGGYSRSL